MKVKVWHFWWRKRGWGRGWACRRSDEQAQSQKKEEQVRETEKGYSPHPPLLGWWWPKSEALAGSWREVRERRCGAAWPPQHILQEERWQKPVPRGSCSHDPGRTGLESYFRGSPHVLLNVLPVCMVGAGKPGSAWTLFTEGLIFGT